MAHGSYQQRKQNQADVLAQIAEHKRLAEMERRRQARDWRLAQQAEALYVQRVRTCCEHAAACARAGICGGVYVRHTFCRWRWSWRRAAAARGTLRRKVQS